MCVHLCVQACLRFQHVCTLQHACRMHMRVCYVCFAQGSMCVYKQGFATEPIAMQVI